MKYFILIIILIPTIAFADTTLSRDGNGQNIQGRAFSIIRSESIGTKGFKCFSTANKISWELKVTSSSTDSASVGFKYFLNGDETKTYPVSDKFFQWQNAPIFKSPNITKACVRCYSSSTLKIASGIFQ